MNKEKFEYEMNNPNEVAFTSFEEEERKLKMYCPFGNHDSCMKEKCMAYSYVLKPPPSNDVSGYCAAVFKSNDDAYKHMQMLRQAEFVKSKQEVKKS